jgi:L-seryl-tRNA(Ser) seleniumtransferase
VVNVVRRELQLIRESLQSGNGALTTIDPVARIRLALEDLRRCRLQRVINATGIIVHTNLGRSPLGPRVLERMSNVASGYCNLEYDLSEGDRGRRAGYLELALATLLEAPAVAVVNNCAAGLVLALRHFTRKPPRTEVLISRGELVQIGGGFRIPEILEASGATLREVGTTNRTTIEDYRSAADPARTAMILRVHRSNFYMEGFVESPPREAIAALAHAHAIPFIEDLGSGAVFDTATLGGQEHEPTPAEALAGGADLITISGDKLVGGPQAGIIAGSNSYVAQLKRDPLFRALRCDKLVLAALESTVDLLLAGQTGEIPIRAIMQAAPNEIRRRAEQIAAHLTGLAISISLEPSDSQIGGGSLPRTALGSTCLNLRPPASISPERLDELLRLGARPVVARIADGAVKIDLRTVLASQETDLVAAIRDAASKLSPAPQPT